MADLSGSIKRQSLQATISNFVVFDHNNSLNIQGGSTLERYHSTLAENTVLAALLAGNLTGVNSIQFVLTDEDSPAVGELKYNPNAGVIEFGAIGGTVVIQIGQEQVVFGRNTTGSTITNGAACRFTGAVGNKPLFGLSDNDATSPPGGSVGLATEDILNNTDGYVTTFGLVRELDTSAWAAGTALFVDSTPGQLTNIPPSSGVSRIVLIGFVLISNASNGVVWVSPINTPFPDELSGARQTITGSRADSEGALKDLLTKMAIDGYITDSTTA